MVEKPCGAWDYLCAEFPEDPTPEQQIIIDKSLMIATEILWARSKRQFGLCEYTIRPCKKECVSGYPWLPNSMTDMSGWSGPWPAIVGGAMVNIVCGKCPTECSCTTVEQVDLPYPVDSVVEVRIDGEVVPPDDYRLDHRRWLVNLAGSWPTCNNLNLPDTAPGTWSVTAMFGTPPPEVAKLAVGELATEIYRACLDKRACQLPVGLVTQIQRQGVTKTLNRASELFGSKRIGLYWSDMFITQYNPAGVGGAASITRLDGPANSRVVIPYSSLFKRSSPSWIRDRGMHA